VPSGVSVDEDEEIGIGDGDARWPRGTFKPHLRKERGLGGPGTPRLPLIRTKHWTNIKNDDKELRIFVTVSVVELSSRVIMLYGVQRAVRLQ
jgi:hypothetical protein